MFPLSQFRIASLTIYALFLGSLVQALSIPKQSSPRETALWIPENSDTLFRRGAPTCGGDSSLLQCGGSYPSDFCCAAHTTCLQLNTTSNIVATLCCPTGQTCSSIAPISCDEGLQNATSNPASQLHANPPTQLQTCGKACCPMGYSCSGGSCFASSAPKSPGSSSTSASSSATAPASTNTSPSSSVASSSTTATSGDETPSAIGSGASSGSSHDGFSGSSFAAGFIPGIAIGVLLVLAGSFIFARRRRNSSDSYLDQKHDPTRDTLTDLGPDMSYRPTMHGRSISGPMPDPTLGYRTDFLQSTPPREFAHSGQASSMGYKVEVSAPASEPTPPVSQAQERLPKVKALFSRSPFLNQAQSPVPTQAPLPDFLKRGTVSYQITPVRGLKKQRSMHSLRRQVTDATARSNSSRRQPQSLSRNGSTETIQVLMQTPDNEALHQVSRPPLPLENQRLASSASWESTDSGDTTPIDSRPSVRYPPTSVPTLHQTMNSTPTRQGRGGAGDVGTTLGTPYSPSNYNNYNRREVRHAGQGNTATGLTVDREPMKRDTTFSAMMERAGLRKEDLLMSGGAGPSDQVPKKR